MAMRLVLFPVFVKQIRNQRAMQTLQPKMKELQAKYKNDKEKLNQEMMALWKENGANPLSGCLPLLLQIPIFISLFHTLREIKPHVTAASCRRTSQPWLLPRRCQGSPRTRSSAPRTRRSSASRSRRRSGPAATCSTRSAAARARPGRSRLVLTVLMGATTFITQRQLMAQNSASGANSQMAQQQKILLYVFPVLFLFYGFAFPIGVLLYWLTTNVWSMVQQRVVIKRMEPVAAGADPGRRGPAARREAETGERKPRRQPAPRTRSRRRPAGGSHASAWRRDPPDLGALTERAPAERNSRSKNRKKRTAMTTESSTTTPTDRADRRTADSGASADGGPAPSDDRAVADRAMTASLLERRATSPRTTSRCCWTSRISTATSTSTSRATAQRCRSSAPASTA